MKKFLVHLALALSLPWCAAAQAQTAATATFVKADTTTAGNWAASYGADGTRIAGYPAALPAYARVSFSANVKSPAWIWQAHSKDRRAPQNPANPAAGARTAASWYNTSGTSWTLDVNLTDGKPHNVALYAAAWSGKDRVQTVQVADATSEALLDARAVPSIGGGAYLQWSVAGHVVFTFTAPNGPNALLTGLYFGGPKPPTVTVSPWVVKSGTLVAFGVTSSAAPKVAGARPAPAPITAVGANPTVYRNGKAVALGAPTWFSRTHELPIVFYRLNCGSVRTIAVAKGGAGYTAPVVKWNGDGGGTSLVLGTPALKAGAITWVPITSCSDDFTSPPTFTVTDAAATTPAVLQPIMSGVAPGDTITYDAPANWISPVLGGSGDPSWTGGKVQPVPAVQRGSVDNWTGRLEGVSGGFGCFAQAPKMLAGANVGSQPSSPGGLSPHMKNRAKIGGWKVYATAGAGKLTTDAGGNPISWTNPAKTWLMSMCHGASGKGPLGDPWPSQTGKWTLRYDDPVAGTPAAMKVILFSRYRPKLVSSTIAGRTVTAIYDIQYPADARTWELNVSCHVKAPAGPDGLGHWTISNLKVIPPDARDGSAQPIADNESDLEPDPNALRALSGVGVTRWVDATQGYNGGPDSNFIFPADPIQPDAIWNQPQGVNRYSARFVAARYFNTNPADATYAWSVTQLTGPQALFNPPIPLAPTDNGFSLGSSNVLVLELRSAKPHGLTTGQQLSVFVGAGGVPVPIAGTDKACLPTNPRGVTCFVTSPTTIAVNLYNPNVVPNSDQPQRVGSTAEVDLTAGGTKPGWIVYGSTPPHSVPYRYTARFASRMPGSTIWTNLPVAGTDALFASIAQDLARELDPSNRIALEFGNEVWAGMSVTQAACALYGRLLQNIPSGTSILGGRYLGTGTRPPWVIGYASYVPMAAHAFDVFTAAAQAAGIDPSRIETTYGSFFVLPDYTQHIVRAAALSNNARVDRVAVAPYWITPNDPTVIAAFSPAGSATAGAQAWPVDAINDFVRHAAAYSAAWQRRWKGHSAALASSKQATKPTLVCYEAGLQQLIPGNVPRWRQIQIDCFAHPSARDLVYGWMAAMQQGDPCTPGTGAAYANFYQVLCNSPYWYLAQGVGQVAGPGTNNRYATYQGGFPADGHEHAGGPGANDSPALQGLQDWGAAVAKPIVP